MHTILSPACLVSGYSYGRRPVEQYRRGYPRLSAFIHSDKEFTVFRRFGLLHTRVLLRKQDIIQELEQRLDELDTLERNAFYLSARRADPSVERRDLMQTLEAGLVQYGL